MFHMGWIQREGDNLLLKGIGQNRLKKKDETYKIFPDIDFVSAVSLDEKMIERNVRFQDNEELGQTKLALV
jgi:hypothetical protein